MRLRRTVINHSSKFGRALGLLLVSSVLIVSFVASSPSFSKYVLDQISTEFSFLSADTGTPLVSIGNVLGTTKQYETLTAGTISPSGATYTIQWQRANSLTGTFIDILEATGEQYYLNIENNNHYIRVAATGTGDYRETVYSTVVGPVVVASIPITSIGPIIGNPIVAQTVVAGSLAPEEAVATYQWKIADSLNGTYNDISGATTTSLTLTEAMIDKYVRIYATGSSTYSGTVYATLGPIRSDKIAITSIGPISGTTQVGQTLTAGLISPVEATVNYQWQRSDSSGSIFTDITGATLSTYVTTTEDLGFYVRVVATATGNYSGIVTSTRSGPVVSASTALEAIGNITGTVQVGSTLTAGALSPTNATATYQWQVAEEAIGPWNNISGATNNTYSIAALYYNKFLRIVATGSGSYSGTQPSNWVGPVLPRPITYIGNISGQAVEGETVTAGAVVPTGATVNYQWRRYTLGNYDSTSLNYTVIGSNSVSYTLVGGDVGFPIRVAATGTGAYTGSVVSQYIVPLSAATPLTYLSSIADILGLTQVFQGLTAGTVSPYGSTVSYQWFRSATMDGTYDLIAGATPKTYTLNGADIGSYFRVRATGSGSYAGVVTSNPAGPISKAPVTAISNISGTASTGQTLTAGTVTPNAATVNYQWLRSDINGENYTPISGATSNTYGVVAADIGKFIKVQATGTNFYSGTVTSQFTGPVTETPTPITALQPISGYPQVGQILTAGATTPLGATVTYQWLRASTSDGTYTLINGATSSTYTTTVADLNQYIKLNIRGSGTYTTSLEGITSAAFGPIDTRPLVSISNIIGKAEVGQIFTAGTVTPVGATVTYQWQSSSDGITYTNITGETSMTYSIRIEDNTKRIRVRVVGTGGYTGTINSNSNGPIGSPNAIQTITDITGVNRVEQTLTAGTVLPFGATVTYQWLRSDTVNGTYEPIVGATSRTYKLVGADQNKYMKVIATGYGLYFGEVISLPTDLVAKGLVSSLSNINGQVVEGQTLSAGNTNPLGATVTYQWQRSNADGSVYNNITNATLSSYQLVLADVGFTLKLVVTGTGAYEGTATSPATGVIQPSGATLTSLTSMNAITGTTTVGQVLTAGSVVPSGSIHTIQWQRSSDNSNFVDIASATFSSYTLTAADYNQYIRTKAVGYNTHTGTVNSASRQVLGQQTITAIAGIQGTAAVGEVIQAGALTPSGATVTYQWLVYTGFKDPQLPGQYTAISGATDYYYRIPESGTPGVGHYIMLRATATVGGAYTGTVTSTYFGPLTQNPSKITAISPILGTPRVNNTLTAGTITPFGAAVTYQWLRKPLGSEIYSPIVGATSSTYQLTAPDHNSTVKVVITGTGGYYGWAESEPSSLVLQGILSSISPILGSTTAGQTLSAGSVNPVSATVTYQWLRSNDLMEYVPIVGANLSTYVLQLEDVGRNIKLQATGSNAFTGTVLSAATGPVTNTAATPLVSLGNFGQTAQVNNTLQAGTIQPTNATVTYQWLRSDTAGGTYLPISGAVSSTYTIKPEDFQKYIKLQITGSGAFSGSITSNATAQITAVAITAIGPYSPTVSQNVNRSLIAGTPTPANAIVSYKWEVSWQNQWFEIGTTTNSVLIPAISLQNGNSNVGQRIRVTITAVAGSGFSGSIMGGEINITAAATQTPLTSLGQIIGTSAVGETLTAGAVSPAGATVIYQWQRSTSSTGTYENVPNATSSTYTLVSGDLGYYFRVLVTGTGDFTGALTSASTGPVIAANETILLVSLSDILNTTTPNLVLTTGTIIPFGANVTYQWFKSDTTSQIGNYTAIPGATSSVYTIPANQDIGFYFKVQVTGSGSYKGTLLSNSTGPVTFNPTPLTSVEIGGLVKVGETLTMANLLPSNATATYQWQIFTEPGGIYTNIFGATATSYTLQPNDYNYYLRLIATGSGAFTGSVSADTATKVVGLLSAAQVYMASPVLGVTPQTAAQIETATKYADYTVTGVTWNEVLTPQGKFKAATTYSATVTLTSKNNKTFVATPFAPIVPSASSVGATTTTGTGVGNTVSFTATFTPTGALMPTSISVSTQPTKLVYVETTDGILALDGMVVTETNNDGTITTSTFTDGTAVGYTSSPANGSALTGAQHTTPVAITHTASAKTANTANLTVETAPSASNVTISGTAAVGATLTGSYTYSDINGDLQGTSTYRWLASGTPISGETANTLVLTAGEAGKTIQFEVTPVALTGTLTGIPVTGNATQAVAASSLSSATLTMTAPVLGFTPESAANVESATSNSDFTVTSVTWNGALTAAGKFKAATTYTATITLTSKNDTTFQTTAFTPTVATASSVGTTTTTGLGIGNTVTFTVTFAQTGALEVTGITVHTQPTKLSYLEMTDDTLSLNGLVLTASHNDGSELQVTFTNGTAEGYTASPAHGSTLTNALNNGLPITITHTVSTETATTNNLTVQAQVAPVASGVAITGTAQVGQTLTGSYTYTDGNGDLEGTSTYQWFAAGSEISGATSATYLVQAADVGKTITFKVTPKALTGLTPGLTVESSPTAAVIA
jgi:hypothetical protein